MGAIHHFSSFYYLWRKPAPIAIYLFAELKTMDYAFCLLLGLEHFTMIFGDSLQKHPESFQKSHNLKAYLD